MPFTYVINVYSGMSLSKGHLGSGGGGGGWGASKLKKHSYPYVCLLCIFYCRTTPILKTLGQFENLVFVIMSTRENIRLIARTPLSLPILIGAQPYGEHILSFSISLF